MEQLCENVEAEESCQDSNVFLSRFKFAVEKSCDKMDGAGSSGQNSCPTGELSEDLASSDSEDLMENRKKLLAEIRSCFRILSIHSRLSGSESPRTRRIITQANSRQSLHSLAMEKSNDINCPTSKELLGADEIQSCLLFNQLITDSSILATSGPASQTRGCQDSTTVDVVASALSEPCSENIHQEATVNPTLQLKPKEDLSKSDVVKVVEWLYRDHPGAVWRAASREAMADQENGNSLIYGEVSFVAFAKLMENYCPKRHTSSSNQSKLSSASSSNYSGENCGFNFYDLGCGGGRCVFMASLLNSNCAKACGIEIVPGMHQMNQILLRLYNMEVRPSLHALKQKQQLVFLLGDFLQMDWSDADVIFTNATCFEDPLFDKFEDMALKILKPGSIVISVARFFSRRERWNLIDEQERRMSWAPAMVYVYRKK